MTFPDFQRQMEWCQSYKNVPESLYIENCDTIRSQVPDV